MVSRGLTFAHLPLEPLDGRLERLSFVRLSQFERIVSSDHAAYVHPRLAVPWARLEVL